jgi:hypothetical protein
VIRISSAGNSQSSWNDERLSAVSPRPLYADLVLLTLRVRLKDSGDTTRL